MASIARPRASSAACSQQPPRHVRPSKAQREKEGHRLAREPNVPTRFLTATNTTSLYAAGQQSLPGRQVTRAPSRARRATQPRPRQPAWRPSPHASPTRRQSATRASPPGRHQWPREAQGQCTCTACFSVSKGAIWCQTHSTPRCWRAGQPSIPTETAAASGAGACIGSTSEERSPRESYGRHLPQLPISFHSRLRTPNSDALLMIRGGTVRYLKQGPGSLNWSCT